MRGEILCQYTTTKRETHIIYPLPIPFAKVYTRNLLGEDLKEKKMPLEWNGF